MIRIIILAVTTQAVACAALRMPVRRPDPSWHRPCRATYRVASHVGNSRELRWAVRDAVGKINDAAGKEVLSLGAQTHYKQWPALTIVRIADPGEVLTYDGGAMPVYSERGKCIDHWIVTVREDGTQWLDAVVLHELGHVAGLEHNNYGLMRPYLRATVRPGFAPAERDEIRRFWK